MELFIITDVCSNDYSYTLQCNELYFLTIYLSLLFLSAVVIHRKSEMGTLQTHLSTLEYTYSYNRGKHYANHTLLPDIHLQ